MKYTLEDLARELNEGCDPNDQYKAFVKCPLCDCSVDEETMVEHTHVLLTGQPKEWICQVCHEESLNYEKLAKQLSEL